VVTKGACVDAQDGKRNYIERDENMSSEQMCPKREKFWREKTIDEQVQTLRFEVKRLKSIVAEQADLLNSLRQHEHLNGKLVVGLRSGIELRFDDDEDTPF